MEKAKKLKKVVAEKQKASHKSNLGKKCFVMDRKSFLNWYDW